MGTLNDLLDCSCAEYADCNAVGVALQQPISYQQFHDHILVLAARLRDCGVQFGDRPFGG